MNLDQLPEAALTLRDLLSQSVPITDAIALILENFDVTEAAVRALFTTHYRATPEDIATQHPVHLSIAGFLSCYRSENSGFHPSRLRYYGARFHITGIKTNTGMEVTTWHRFLIPFGLMIRAVDELTLEVWDLHGSEFIDDVARQIGWKRWADWPVVGPQPSKLFEIVHEPRHPSDGA